MTYIKFGLLALTISFFANLSIAQERRGILSHSEELELTEDQKEAIWEIGYEAKKKHQQKVHSKEGVMQKMRDRAVVIDSALDSILSAEQKIRWEEIKEEKKKERSTLRAEQIASYVELRQEYFDNEMQPVLQPLRASFDQHLSDEEKAVIQEAQHTKQERANESEERMNRRSTMGKYHKELSKIAFDNKAELDEIWNTISEDLSRWQLDLANLAPNRSDKEESIREKPIRSKGHRRAGFSTLEFLMMDF